MDRIYKEAKEAEGNLVVLCYGPMTNLALAIFKYPDICELIKKVVFVGGSYDFGDVSAVVEANMATDPEAARAVFQSGIRMEMYGYNVELNQHWQILKLVRSYMGQTVHIPQRLL